jgi:hypothetical protein
VRGAFPRLLALPDRWWSWWLGAVPAGLRLIRTFKPDVLWTTYPVATAHLIGATLHRLTAIPWVADFRDPMAQDDYPADPLTHKAFEWVERRTLNACTKAIFTAPGALRLYAERYPGVPGSRLEIIENGYDEASFAGLEAGAPGGRDRPLTSFTAGPSTAPSATLVRCWLPWASFSARARSPGAASRSCCAPRATTRT